MLLLSTVQSKIPGYEQPVEKFCVTYLYMREVICQAGRLANVPWFSNFEVIMPVHAG
jgi:hypothetical protein